tara:strand:- start:23 stop:286 length:264 start_codon:yes stop_codon:yes gene_type:complete
MKIDTEADYVLEAYWMSYKLVNDVVKKKEKNMLACVTCYNDFMDEESNKVQLQEMLALRDKFTSLYCFHPDGEVTVELTIRQEYVNV